MPVHRLPHRCLALALALLLLLVSCLANLQTIPNGSSHYFMIDVGETQIVLNEWGSLHPTGYPLYVISGNIFTGIQRALSVGPLVAATLVSLLWGVLALLLMFILATRPGFAPWLAGNSAGVAPNLAREIFQHIATLNQEVALAFLIVEHRLDIIFDYVNQVIVLHMGKVLAAGKPGAIVKDARVREVYLGL